MGYGIRSGAKMLIRDGIFVTRSTLRMTLRESPPVIICNSYPKSGTHLLSQLLQSLTGIPVWNDIISMQALCGRMNSLHHIKAKYQSAPSGTIIRTHLSHSDDIQAILDSRAHVRFFIYRDPRDVVLSFANWVEKEPRYYLHSYYKNVLLTRPNQIRATIAGVPLGSILHSAISSPDIGTDFARWCGWLQDTPTLCIGFENIVGVRGGGSEIERNASIQRICQHLQSSFVTPAQRDHLASSKMDPNESHTFRVGRGGRIGGWRTDFQEDHINLFRKVASNVLLRFGYEQSDDWV